MNSSGSLMVVKGSREEKLAEYEELLLRRDQLFREAGSYLTSYTKEFGDLLTANFEIRLECIKKKKAISYCRRRMNRGLPVDTAGMQEEIEREMTLYYAQLEELTRETEEAKQAKNVGAFRFEQAKKIYVRLAKKLHPDIYRETSENEDLKDLWNRITAAYHRSDLDELEDLEVLVRRQLESLGADAPKTVPDDLERRIERVEAQINDILTTAPHTYGELLADEVRKEEMKERLREEHAEYEEYLQNLTQALEDMLREGGVKLVWKLG
ncbi:MAG: hypothetical protein IJL66_09510 [Lachnospiraceae bacterium]|nr:hypothetical protein [Lachnospiraceae bacterium]